MGRSLKKPFDNLNQANNCEYIPCQPREKKAKFAKFYFTNHQRRLSNTEITI